MRSVLAKVGVWLAASFAAAAAAHVVLGIVGTTYAERTHVAIVPLGLLTLTMLATAFAFVVARALDDGDARVAERIRCEMRSISIRLAIVSVASGAVTTLATVETIEQLATHGRITGLVDALGGDPRLGIAIVAIAAWMLLAVARSCAEPIVALTVTSALHAAMWIVACFSDRLAASRVVVSYRSSTSRARAAARSIFVIGGCGLRAPPAAG